jgi:hypothetical protein
MMAGRPFLLASLAALLWSLAVRLVTLSAFGAHAQTVLDSLQNGTASSIELLSNSVLTLPAAWSSIRLGSSSDVFAKSYSLYAKLESETSLGRLPAIIVCPPAADNAPLEDTERGRKFVFWLDGMASLSVYYVRFRNCRSVISLQRSATLQVKLVTFQSSWLAIRAVDATQIMVNQTVFENTMYTYNMTREDTAEAREKVTVGSLLFSLVKAWVADT